MGVDLFKEQMFDKGYCAFPDFIGMELVEQMRNGLVHSYIECALIQVENCLNETQGTSHHIIGSSNSFMECLKRYEKLDEYLTAYFGGKYILNSFGGNILTKGISYANDIHRDIKSYSWPLPLMLNTLIMLDDFTEDNGATWLMEYGHLCEIKPPEHVFNVASSQITGKAGTLVVWNSNMWHRAGENKTDKPRRSVTPEFTRPFMKQGFDYTQYVTEETPEYLKQVLGYYSRTPKTLDEWYQPKERRMYRSDQG